MGGKKKGKNIVPQPGSGTAADRTPTPDDCPDGSVESIESEEFHDCLSHHDRSATPKVNAAGAAGHFLRAASLLLVAEGKAKAKAAGKACPIVAAPLFLQKAAEVGPSQAVRQQAATVSAALRPGVGSELSEDDFALEQDRRMDKMAAMMQAFEKDWSEQMGEQARKDFGMSLDEVRQLDRAIALKQKTKQLVAEAHGEDTKPEHYCHMAALEGYDPKMPSPTPYGNLNILGFNAKERARLRVGQRLMHLSGGAAMVDPKEAEHTLTKQLETLVLHGGHAKDILSAREQVSRLRSICNDLRDEVHYLQNHPEEANAIEGYDYEQATALRAELFQMSRELDRRAGDPEPMKSAAAERMRQKLEAKLLPSLNKEIPRWAERLRFMHAEVLKWMQPDRLLQEQPAVNVLEEDPLASKRAEEAAAKAEAELLEAKKNQVEAPAVPKPKGKELEMLKAMGWNPDDMGADDLP